MAVIDCELRGNLFEILGEIENTVLNASISASLEGSAETLIDGVYTYVRVFERYSYIGKNRVSLNVTLTGNLRDRLHLVAVTSGGSEALFFKINTIGENNFLKTIEPIVAKYRVN